MYTLYIMKDSSNLRRTQIYLEEDVLVSLRRRAEKEGTTLAALVREALSLYMFDSKKANWDGDPIQRIAGLGRSKRGDLAKNHDRYLYRR